jgi:hypothetical protein
MSPCAVQVGAQQVSQSPAPDSGPLAKVITPYAFSRRMSVKICIVEDKVFAAERGPIFECYQGPTAHLRLNLAIPPISNFENPTPVTTPSFEKP